MADVLTAEALVWLQHNEAQALLRQHAAADPAALALQLQPRWGVRAAWLATQVQLRQKHALRLPRFVQSEALLSARACEQASSAAAAALRWRNLQCGQLAIDLTAGLGSDTLMLAQRFRRVLAVEAHPVLADLLRVNLRRMGVPNVEVVQANAEAFLSNAPPADFLYLDPDRRPGVRRGVALSDIQPNLPDLLPRLRALAPRIHVKLSPLFDLAEAFRALPGLHQAWALSVAGEVKETGLAWDGQATEPPSVMAQMDWHARLYLLSLPYETWRQVASLPCATPEPGAFLFVPDAAVYKARMLPAVLPLLPQAAVTGPEGYIHAPALAEGLPGRSFRIRDVQPYKPKALAIWLRDKGIRQANVAVRDFPLPVADLRRVLHLGEGGIDFLFFTTDRSRSQSGSRLCLHCQPAP